MAQLKTTGDVKIGLKSYTDSNLTPNEIATLAFAYTTAPTGKVIGKNLDKNINVANDLAKLTGGKQLQPGMQTGNKALLVFILKNKLVSTDEYKDLYRKLVDLHKKVVSAINKTNPKGSAKAGRAASKDMKGEFDENVNEANVPKYYIKQMAVLKDIDKLSAERKKLLDKWKTEKDPKKKQDIQDKMKKLTNDIHKREANVQDMMSKETEYGANFGARKNENINEGKEERIWSGVLESLDKLFPDWDGGDMKTFNRVAEKIQRSFKGIPVNTATQLAVDFQEYKQGSSDKKKTVQKMINTMKKHRKQKESVNEADNSTKHLNKVRKLAKKFGFTEIKDGAKWLRQNGYEEEKGIKTIALFVDKKDKKNKTYVEVYQENNDPDLQVSFYSWGGTSGNDSIGDWTHEDTWKDEFGEDINEAKTDEPEVITQLRNVVKRKQQQSIIDPLTNKTVKVDLFSAQAILAVYDKLSPKNQKQYVTTTIPRMAEVAFKLIK